MVYLSTRNIIHMLFIDFKGTARGHSWVIGMCYYSIFYISCIEREPGITQDYSIPVVILKHMRKLSICVHMSVACCYAKCTLCRGCAWNN